MMNRAIVWILTFLIPAAAYHFIFYDMFTDKALYFVVGLLPWFLCFILSLCCADHILTMIFKSQYKKFLARCNDRNEFNFYQNCHSFYKTLHKGFRNVAVLDDLGEYEPINFKGDMIIPLIRANWNINTLNKIGYAKWSRETSALPNQYISFGHKKLLRDLLPQPVVIEAKPQQEFIPNHLDNDIDISKE